TRLSNSGKVGKHYETGCWKRLILIWDNASYHVNQMVRDYVNTQKDWLTIFHLPKKAPYMNPNERRVNQQIKSDVCANRFYQYIEEKTRYPSTLTNNLEYGAKMTFAMTLDLVLE
ncbi:MAG: transposase, partial [Candidatus Nitrosopolaris sp.]